MTTASSNVARENEKIVESNRSAATGSPTPSAAPESSDMSNAPPVEYSYSGGLLARLAQLDVSLAFSSYQSGLLYTFGCRPDTGGAHLHQNGLLKPMGIACNSGEIVVSTGFQIIRFANVLEPHERVNNLFDACYVPRTVHVTGELDAHDVGIDGEGRPVFVNTRFNCLATVSDRHSFEPLWRPPFISALADEDRCHLNGMAMRDGRPAYVTAVSRSDTIDGWRDRRADGGVVIDVATDAIVCEGLSMPHSPRLYDGRLWVLNAGTGELGIVHLPQSGGKGRFEPVVFCPGFLRGLAFRGKHAFVGLSKPRYKRFEGLALDERLTATDSEPWCGIQVIDLEKRICVDWFRIDGDVAEIYDLALTPGFSCPMTLSPVSSEAMELVTFDRETAGKKTFSLTMFADLPISIE